MPGFFILNNEDAVACKSHHSIFLTVKTEINSYFSEIFYEDIWLGWRASNKARDDVEDMIINIDWPIFATQTYLCLKL